MKKYFIILGIINWIVMPAILYDLMEICLGFLVLPLIFVGVIPFGILISISIGYLSLFVYKANKFYKDRKTKIRNIGLFFILTIVNIYGFYAVPSFIYAAMSI